MFYIHYGIKTPDFLVNGQKFDLKQINGIGKYVIQGNLKNKQGQARNFIIDITNSDINVQEATHQIIDIYNSIHYLWINIIILIKNNDVLKIYKRS